ncbi:MAG: DNA polymerase III subunit delta' [Candidatus Pacebacteria bacterium]|nr:DNA polymerase III subunit delta' [Candidatus Paceibacterota bacterium]
MVFIGHQNQWDFLKRVVENDKVPQALIFAGVEGLGKKLVALEFAKLLSCEAKQKAQRDPCHECYSCLTIEQNTFPDVFLIEPKNKEIQIEQIRELQNKVGLRPHLAERKVVIVDQAEALNQQAANCFLKTLEEPRGDVIFILITSQPERLLATIRSRCSILKFYPVPQEQIIKHLAKDVSPETLREVWPLAGGRVGMLLNLLEKKNYSVFHQTIKEIRDCLDGSLTDNFLFIKKLLASENNSSLAISFLDHFILYLRNLLIAKLGLTDGGIVSGFSFKKEHSLSKISQMIKEAERMRAILISTNVSPRLILENLFINVLSN